MMEEVEKLYEYADKLANAKGLSIKAHKDEYEKILDGVKGNDQCKRLSSQFIARFFTHFPELTDRSIDAILDLCEDENVDIRKQAVKDLPTLCRDNKANLPKIADVLTQLLQTDDSVEIVVIQNSIMTLFRRDCKGTIIGIFSQIHNGEEIVRDRALRLLHTKLKTGGPELLGKEGEAQLIAEIKKVFSSDVSVTGEEFPRLMALLNLTKLPTTVSGQLEMANMVMSMAELDQTQEFDYTSQELTDRLLQCAQHALPFFSAQVKSSSFCEYLCSRVLPHYYQLPSLPGVDTRAQLCKLLAELTTTIGSLNEPKDAAKNVFERLIDYMPLPPIDADGSLADVPDLEFTKVECLMYTFHGVGRQAEEFLTEDQERLKDFRQRLQYLARGVTGYIKKLNEFLASPEGNKVSDEDFRIKKMALRSTENIQAMIRDLFHSPPSYKANVTLSWLPLPEKKAIKRKPIAYEEKSVTGSKSPKKVIATKPLYMDKVGGRGDRRGGARVSNYRPAPRHVKPSGLYAPPTGKYSNNIASPSDRPSRGRGRW